jgi:hypothetical protein
VQLPNTAGNPDGLSTNDDSCFIPSVDMFAVSIACLFELVHQCPANALALADPPNVIALGRLLSFPGTAAVLFFITINLIIWQPQPAYFCPCLYS